MSLVIPVTDYEWIAGRIANDAGIRHHRRAREADAPDGPAALTRLMPNRLHITRLAPVLVAGALLAACSDAPTAIPASRPEASAPALARVFASQDAALLACPSSVTRSASAVIGRRGGIVSVDGTALVVPPNAVARNTRFTVTIPASSYVEVDVSAEGYEHFTFRHPVAITISYARCADDALPASSLDAWWIDPSTREQLDAMVGVDDRQHRRLTFLTDHLSGYAVAYRTGEEWNDAER